jgi:hypothetical protein
LTYEVGEPTINANQSICKLANFGIVVVKKDNIWIIALFVLVVAFLVSGICENPYSRLARSAVINIQQGWTKPADVALPKLTAQQAQGVVVSAIYTSTVAIQQRSHYYEVEFNYSTRQWMVTTWSSEEASKQFAGSVYIVDDATGKLLNPPPIYTPK